MIFEPIAEYLESALGLVQGSSIFINQIPASVPFGVLLKDGLLGTSINGEIPGLRRGNFQVAIRGKSRTVVSDMMKLVMASLTIQETDFSEYIMKSCRATNEPTSFMLSTGDYFEMSVNFYAVYVIVAQ